MNFNGFDEVDFNLFLIPGLDERMEMLRNQLRPKFECFAMDLTDDLSMMMGQEMVAHIARHARRKMNPPNDSWIAFSGSSKGYKMMPHFQICLWNTHVLIQWGIIYEAIHKDTFAIHLIQHMDKVKLEIPDDFHWFKDHMKPEGKKHSEMMNEDFNHFAERLRFNKNGEVMVGKVIPRSEALTLSPGEFYRMVLDTWNHLIALHHLSL